MAKKSTLQVKGATIRTLQHNGIDYICITDIARQKNPAEPKDVVKNWMRLKNTLEYLGLWEQLNNPALKGSNSTPFGRSGKQCVHHESFKVGGTDRGCRHLVEKRCRRRDVCAARHRVQVCQLGFRGV